jgi:hypothetical protein
MKGTSRDLTNFPEKKNRQRFGHESTVLPLSQPARCTNRRLGALSTDLGGWGEPLTVSRHVIAAQMKAGTGRVPNFAGRIAMHGYNSWEDYFFAIVKRWFVLSTCLYVRNAIFCTGGLKN